MSEPVNKVFFNGEICDNALWKYKISFRQQKSMAWRKDYDNIQNIEIFPDKEHLIEIISNFRKFSSCIFLSREDISSNDLKFRRLLPVVINIEYKYNIFICWIYTFVDDNHFKLVYLDFDEGYQHVENITGKARSKENLDLFLKYGISEIEW